MHEFNWMNIKCNERCHIIVYCVIMVDSESLLPEQKEKKQNNTLAWTYYISLALSIVAVLLAIISYFKKVLHVSDRKP